MSRKIKLPTGAEAEVVEHAPGEWSGRVPAALEDWTGTGAADCRLAETEATWAEQIARTTIHRKINLSDVKAAVVAERLRLGRVTMEAVAGALRCDVRTVRSAIKAGGSDWKALKK